MIKINLFALVIFLISIISISKSVQLAQDVKVQDFLLDQQILKEDEYFDEGEQKDGEHDGELKKITFKMYNDCMNQNCKERVSCQKGSENQNNACKKWKTCMGSNNECNQWSSSITSEHTENELIPNEILQKCVEECPFEKVNEVNDIMDCTLECAGVPFKKPPHLFSSIQKVMAIQLFVVILVFMI